MSMIILMKMIKQWLPINNQKMKSANIETVKKNNEGHLLALPNVIRVEVGQEHNEDVIKVHIVKKIPERFLLKPEIIPKKLEGFKVLVEEVHMFSSDTHE